MASPLWLQKWVRNEFYNAIKAVGLDPNDFALEVDGDEVTFRHRWSSSCFTIRNDSSVYRGAAVVGELPAWPYESYGLAPLIEYFSFWLTDVKRDLDTPDLWADMLRDMETLQNVPDSDAQNTPFTSDEQSEIETRLGALAQHVTLVHSLSAEQAQVLDTKIDYLVRASRRSGRIDWSNTLAGVIFSYLFSVALPPEAARTILSGLLRSIGHFHGLPGLDGP